MKLNLFLTKIVFIPKLLCSKSHDLKVGGQERQHIRQLYSPVNGRKL